MLECIMTYPNSALVCLHRCAKKRDKLLCFCICRAFAPQISSHVYPKTNSRILQGPHLSRSNPGMEQKCLQSIRGQFHVKWHNFPHYKYAKKSSAHGMPSANSLNWRGVLTPPFGIMRSNITKQVSSASLHNIL